MHFLLLLVLLPNYLFAMSESVPQPKSIFLLGGQSNMGGRGGVVEDNTPNHKMLYWDQQVPYECRPNNSILRLAKDNVTWELALEPLHKDIDTNNVNGIGPGMPFANSILGANLELGVIGLVPCAMGGSKIGRWQRGTGLYERLISRAKNSVKNGGNIKALLWFQGGADAENYNDAASYKFKVSKFFSDVRADLNSPDLLILQVAIPAGKKGYSNMVREAQLSLQLPNVYTVDSNGSPTLPDQVHFNTEGQIRLGKTLADAYLRLMH